MQIEAILLIIPTPIDHAHERAVRQRIGNAVEEIDVHLRGTPSCGVNERHAFRIESRVGIMIHDDPASPLPFEIGPGKRACLVARDRLEAEYAARNHLVP